MYPVKRSSHNWLIHKIGNAMVQARLPALSGHVLDVGCGERPFEVDILAYASVYTGMDWASTLHNLKADVVADANRSLPFRDKVFDHVLAFEVLEHLAEPEAMLQEAFRVLRTDGGLTLSMPFQWWVHEAPWDYQRFTDHGLRYRLEKVGFTDIEIQPRTGFWSMWILKLNYQTVRLVRGRWWRRIPARLFLTPFWFANQTLAPLLDRVWHEDRETAGYFVTARKP